MSEFSVESEGVDVERIMEQIRARIRANRGAEASDAQTRQQAGSRAEQLVDPGGARSALAARPRPEPTEPAPRPSESFEFDQDTIYRSSRGAIGRLLYGVRRLLSPLLKFFFNIQPVAHALAVQSRINRQQAAFDDRVARLFDASSARLEAREEIDKLNHQVMLDLVAEMTRLSVEMKNHRALVESVSARLDFFERQARAREAGARSGAGSQATEQPGAEGRTEGAEPTRRRRRRGRRRSGRAATATDTATETTETAAEASGAVRRKQPTALRRRPTVRRRWWKARPTRPNQARHQRTASPRQQLPTRARRQRPARRPRQPRPAATRSRKLPKAARRRRNPHRPPPRNRNPRNSPVKTTSYERPLECSTTQSNGGMRRGTASTVAAVPRPRTARPAGNGVGRRGPREWPAGVRGAAPKR